MLFGIIIQIVGIFLPIYYFIHYCLPKSFAFCIFVAKMIYGYIRVSSDKQTVGDNRQSVAEENQRFYVILRLLVKRVKRRYRSQIRTNGLELTR